MLASHSKITITNLEVAESPFTTPPHKQTSPTINSSSPRRLASKPEKSSVEQKGATNPQSSAFLSLPQSGQEDLYNTPTNGQRHEGTSSSSTNVKQRRLLVAPKKRSEYLDSSARKNRAFDPDNLSVRPFKLSPSHSDESDDSTENSSWDG